MIPKLRFTEFTEAWSEKSIGDIATISRGRFSPRPRNDPRYYGGDTEFIQTSEVVGANPNILNGSKSLNEEGVKVSKVFPSGTIAMTIAANIGYVGFANRPVAFPDSLVGINAFEDILPKYLFYVLSRKQRRLDYIAEEAAQKNITSPTVRKFKIWHTTNQKEQVALTNLFELINLKINLLTKKKEALETYKRGLMRKIFSQELRFKREDGTDYPDWGNLTIGDISEERSERGFEEYPLLSITLYDGIVPQELGGKSDSSSSDKSNYKLIKVDDIGYNSMRMWQGASGVSAFEGIVSPAYTILTLNERADAQYIGFLFKTNKLIGTFKSHSQGLTSDTWNLKYPTLKRIKVKLPSLEEQLRVVRVLNQIDLNFESLSNRINLTEELKKGLLQQMFV